MRIVYKRSLAFIAFLLAICGFIGVAYLFYDKVILDETLVIVEGSLSINYINGNKINSDGEYSFSITNNGANDIYYDILADEVTHLSSELSYNLSSSEANVNHINGTLNENNYALYDNILIPAGETQNFVLTLKNISDMSFKLYIKEKDEAEEYFYATILKNNTIKKSSNTKVGEQIATTNEGLIEDVDDDGVTYYFRGNVTNNYVSFADNLWRIVRINGDETVKLVLNGVSSELANYNANMDNYEDIEKSTISALLSQYYENNLKNYDSYIANSKYCKEGIYSESNSEKIYSPYSRLITNKIPTFNCLGDKYASKIGLLTADEVVYAGANFTEDNKEYYLYNEKIENIWWTSTLAKAKSTEFFPFSVSIEGKIIDTTNGTLYRNLRPSINLIKKITVTGKGTIDDPYIIN